MGNPDLELQVPSRDQHRHQHRGPTPRRFIAHLCITAVAAGMFLTMAIGGLFDGIAPTTPSLLHQLLLLHPQPCPARHHAEPHGQAATSSSPGDVFDVYLQRRNVLAEALQAEGVEAFVAEPGPIFEYYANISQTDWEAFAPSQRPLLMVVRPVERHRPSSSDDGVVVAVAAEMALLAPRAQADGARALLRRAVRGPGGAELVTWHPRANPYRTLRTSRLFAPVDIRRGAAADQRPMIMAGPETRAVVVNGLGDAGFRYRRLAPPVARLLPSW